MNCPVKYFVSRTLVFTRLFPLSHVKSPKANGSAAGASAATEGVGAGAGSAASVTLPTKSKLAKELADKINFKFKGLIVFTLQVSIYI